MKPAALEERSFAAYPAGGRTLAVEHLGLLRRMPLALLPNYLQQLQAYDALFPVEQARLRRQLIALEAHPEWLQPFAAISLPAQLEQMDWVRRPSTFVSTLSGALWQTQQIDAYHRAAETLFAQLPGAGSAAAGPAPLLIAVLGRDAHRRDYPLFLKLRPQGMHVRQVRDADAAAMLSRAVAARAEAAPAAYSHWYVDGGEPWQVPAPALSRFSFPQLAPVTKAVLSEMDRAVRQGSGPEALADHLHTMSPAELGLEQVTSDPRLARFLVQVLTQGSGTQLYSTSFVQAAAVELVRRAQPQTLLLRFAPRRKPASMNDMLEQRAQSVELDADGALIDADMGLYYAWLALQKQPGGAQASLLAYVEGRGEAFVAGPAITRNSESSSPISIEQLLMLLA